MTPVITLSKAEIVRRRGFTEAAVVDPMPYRTDGEGVRH